MIEGNFCEQRSLDYRWGPRAQNLTATTKQCLVKALGVRALPSRCMVNSHIPQEPTPMAARDCPGRSILRLGEISPKGTSQKAWLLPGATSREWKFRGWGLVDEMA